MDPPNITQFYSQHVEKFKPIGNGQALGLCPFHDDTSPSLSVNLATGEWFCHSCKVGGGQRQFAERLEIEVPLDGGAKRLGAEEAVYNYHAEDGQLLYQVVRFPGKEFRQRQPDGAEGWKWNLKGVTRVLYHLPELKGHKKVYIVEGEKDVDRLWSLGIPATTSPMGAGKWKDGYADQLKTSGVEQVIVLPDNDAEGRKHAEDVARSCNKAGLRVKVVHLPNLPNKGDASDWLAAGGTPEGLETFVEAEPPYVFTNEEPFKTPASEFVTTDLGNAERLVERHGRDLRYCHPWKKWFVWGGQRFSPDETGEVERRGKETVRAIYFEAAEGADKNQASVAKHAIKSGSEPRLRAMVSLARMDVPLLPSQLDENPWLLNLQNGTFNLKTGEMGAHKREHLITKMAPVKFDPAAKCPVWLRFLDRIMGGNKDLIGFLQKAVGYSLTGSITEQCFFILWGKGSNGKTTFLETIRNLLGDYAQQADFSTFLTKRNTGATNDLAALQGARLVCASEIGTGRYLNEGLVKQVTGGEPIRARFLYSEYFEFHPQFKLFLATNCRPNIRGTDLAIWRRVRLVPFDVTIPQEEQDHGLLAKLLKELPGILNWALKGCREWMDHGLGESEAVEEATREYRMDMDLLGNFIEDRCLLDPEASVVTSELKEAYKRWCEDNSENDVGTIAFANYLRSHGCSPDRRGHGGGRIWRGVKLT